MTTRPSATGVEDAVSRAANIRPLTKPHRSSVATDELSGACAVAPEHERQSRRIATGASRPCSPPLYGLVLDVADDVAGALVGLVDELLELGRADDAAELLGVVGSYVLSERRSRLGSIPTAAGAAESPGADPDSRPEAPSPAATQEV